MVESLFVVELEFDNRYSNYNNNIRSNYNNNIRFVGSTTLEKK